MIIENTQEAIIDKQTWESVQKLRKIPAENKSGTKLSDASNILEKDSQGKSVALYLSDEVNKMIIKTAKQKDVSKSKLVDSMLRQAFFY